MEESSVLSKLSEDDYPYAIDVLAGLTNPDIAKNLGVHPQTVKRRLSSICTKLGVTTKSELMDYLLDYL